MKRNLKGGRQTHGTASNSSEENKVDIYEYTEDKLILIDGAYYRKRGQGRHRSENHPAYQSANHSANHSAYQSGFQSTDVSEFQSGYAQKKVFPTEQPSIVGW